MPKPRFSFRLRFPHLPRVRLPHYGLWLMALSVVFAVGVYAALQVFIHGLQVTNLTDLVPWGLWITLDLSSIAMSAGAFSLCAVVYLVGLKQYEPVARTATFIGIIGYSMAMICLLMDIGRPDRFWHGFVFWNVHSVLWEVTMCVGLYFSVLLIETMPIIARNTLLQRYLPWLARLLSSLHHFAPVLAIFGLGFSLLHQSSLGATYGVLQARPAWYRPGISVLFIFSAVLAGISLTLFSSMLAARLSRRARVDDRLLERLAHAVGWGVLGYLYFRFWDSFAVNYTYQPGRSEGLQMLTSGSLSLNFWVFEIFLGAALPAFILLRRSLRQQPRWRMLALAGIVLGVVAYRWDTTLLGQLIVLTYLPQEIVVRYTSYTPSLIELLSSAGVVAYGLLAFTIGVQYLGVVDHRADHAHAAAHSTAPAHAGAEAPATAPAAAD